MNIVSFGEDGAPGPRKRRYGLTTLH